LTKDADTPNLQKAHNGPNEVNAYPLGKLDPVKWAGEKSVMYTQSYLSRFPGKDLAPDAARPVAVASKGLSLSHSG